MKNLVEYLVNEAKYSGKIEKYSKCIYNQCQIAYNENFKNLKEDVNPTTEFIQIDGILYGNPFLIYEFFQL